MHGFLNLSQTNFLVFNLINTLLFTLFKEKRVITTFTVLMFSTLFVSSCSTKSTTKQTDRPLEVIIPKVAQAITAEEKLALAQSLNKQLLNVKSLNGQSTSEDRILLSQQARIHDLLIEACELFTEQQNYTKALWLANEITNIYQEGTQNNYRLLLVKARSLLALNYHQQAQQQLKIASELVTYNNNENVTPSLVLTLDYYQILNNLLTVQEIGRAHV